MAMTTSIGTGKPRKRPRRAAFRRRESWFGFLLAVPALVAFASVILYPFLRSFVLAFYEFTLMTPEPVFIGLENFERLLTNVYFLQSWIATFIFVVGAAAATFVLGLGWSLILNQAFAGRTFIRATSLLPWVLPSTVVAFLWAFILHGQFGILNALLVSIGAIEAPITYLSHPMGARAAVIVAKSWASLAVVMSFMLAALQSLPNDQVEAARMDGAGNWSVLWHVVFPHLRPAIVVVVVLQAMGCLQQIDIIYAMTGGGPVRATQVMSIEVYSHAFEDWDVGTAAAMGVIWFFVISIPAGIYLRTLFRD